MSSEKSKPIILASIAVTLLLAWQMKSQMPFASSLPEEYKLASSGPHQRNSATAVTLTATATSYREPNKKEELVRAIYAAKECYTSETCDFPETDPKSYQIAVGQNLKNLLEEYRSRYGKDPKNREEAEGLAREFIKSGDEYVQSVSLEILSDQPPSPENLQALTEGLNGTSDPLLVAQSMTEMKRYLNTSQEPQVHEFIRHLLGQSGVFSSQKAAQIILSFINPNSFPDYDNLARSLPPHSTVAKDLRTALEEYRRLQTGG